MRIIKSKLRMWLIAVCAVMLIVTMSLGLTACRSKELKIDVPDRIEEDLGTGTYVVPRYDVVNEAGVIMAGYTVRLKSATDPNGNAAEISKEASTIVTLVGAGEYIFVYTADSDKVDDVTVIMDFADRTAPTIKLSSSQFPAFFIQGVTYAVPEYTLAGDYVGSRCYSKVLYNDGQGGDDEEVTLEDGFFAVEHEAGKYTVLIHVEDAAGNFNDYRYTRSVYSPEHYDPATVVYFNEAFGEKQVAPDGNYAGKFVSVADGGKAYGDEAGSYKVVFDGSETANNEAYFSINVPAIANIMAYKELEMYVYIEDDGCANGKTQWVVGSKWWNDTAVKSGEWTRVTWSVKDWGGDNGNSGVNNSNVISTDNISGTRIRLIPDADYTNKTPPHGTVYFSAMRAVPYVYSQVTAGENVTLDKPDGSYLVGETVTLTAKEIAGKTFDCFLINGKPIGGNLFVATEEAYQVEAKYIDGDLTADNMTWGVLDSYRTEGGDTKTQKLGTGTHWVLSYQPEFAETGWVYTAAYVGGANQLFGIEMHSDNDMRKLCGYGGAWKGTDPIHVSADVRDALRNSKKQPVTLVYVRNGETVGVYLQTGAGIDFIGSIAFSAFEVGGNDFGLGERGGDIRNAAFRNIKWVVGEERTNLYLQSLMVALDLDENVTTDKDGYYLGETVTLTAKEITGKTFDCFLIDGKPMSGNTFVASDAAYKVEAKYVDGELTADNMTWSKADGYQTEGTDAKVQKLGTGTHWVLTYQPEFAEAGWVYTAAYVGGSQQLFGIEMHSDNDMRKLCGYGSSKGTEPISVSVAVRDALRASKTKPVTLVYIRNGETVGAYLKTESGIEFIGSIAFSVFETDGNDFGIGERAGDIQNATLKNIKWVIGEERVNLYLKQLAVTLDLDENVTTDKDGYYLGETVTLTAGEAPQGKAFAYFTANGEKLTGNTLVLRELSYEIVAVYTEISELTLCDGIETADGKTTVGKGATVTLVYKGISPAGKYFIGFRVDGVALDGNTFETTDSAHRIEAIFEDTVEAGNEQLNDADASIKTSSDNPTWHPSQAEYVTDRKYDGIDGDVKEKGSLKVTLSGNEQSFALAGAPLALNLSDYKEFYFYAYTEVSGLQAGGWWCKDTKLVPGTWTKVTFTRADAPLNLSGANVWDEDSIAEFVYRIKDGSAGAVVYVTSVYGVPYADVSVTVDDAVKNYVSIEGACKEEHTIEFVIDGAPEGKAFAYFTVNGLRYDGTTYKLGTDGIIVGAVFNDISKLTLGGGITTSNGNTTVGKGATVTLVLDESTIPNGKLFDYFTVDGERIVSDTFETTASSHTVAVVFADGAETLTWVTSEEARKSDVAYNWSEYSFSGQSVAESTYWVIEAKAYGFTGLGDKWYSIDFLVGKNASLQIRLHSVGNAHVYAMGDQHKDGTKLTDLDASVIQLCKEATQEAPVTFTAIRSGNTYYVLIDGVLVLKTQFAFNVSENKFGVGGTDCGAWLTAHPTVTYKYRAGEAIAEHCAKVTVTGTKVTLDKQDGVYALGDTVTLTHDAAAEGYAFSHYTVDGKKIEGNSFVANKNSYSVEAVYAESSTVRLANGITTADGETLYARGVKVALVLDESTIPNGKLFDYFTVDGERIVGNTFETTAPSHTVAVVFADGAENLTWVTSEEAQKSDVAYNWSSYSFSGKAFGESDHWVIKANLGTLLNFATGETWIGFDVLVGTNSTIQFRLHTSGIVDIRAMGTEFKDGNTEIGTILNKETVIAKAKKATDDNPLPITVIRNGNVYYILVDNELTLKSTFDYKGLDNKFGLGATNCGAWLPMYEVSKYEYRTGEAIAEHCAKVIVTGTKVTLDKQDGGYVLGDTVTLTHDAAEEGYAFSHYTVDGKKIEGDSFVANKNSYTVEAVYAEISELTLGEGVITADGETQYARGVQVRLSFDSEKLNGKVVDYYLVDKGTDSEIRVYNGAFTTSSATHTVEAVLVEASEMTWADGGAEYDCETVMGDSASVLKARAFDGEVYGAAEYWAVSVDVKFENEWVSFEFVQGSTQSIRVRVHKSGYCGIVLSVGTDTESEEIPSPDFTVAYPTKNPQVVNKLLAGATVTCVRNGGTIKLYADGYLFFTTNYAVDHTGNWFGVGYVNGKGANKPQMTNTKFITGQDKVEAYLEKLTVASTRHSETQINAVVGSTAKDNSELEYITVGIPEGLNDENVKETGVLKVTAGSNDVGLFTGYTFDTDASAYDEIFYYVYIESNEPIVNVGAGAYWKDNTQITANTWVKVTLDSAMIAELSDGANTDLSKITLRIYSQTWIDGYTAIQGKTVYVTSLYGVPKTAE